MTGDIFMPFKKSIVPLIIFIAYLVSILMCSISKANIYTKVLTIIGLVCGAVIFLYDKSDFVFKWWNIWISLFSRSTVKWEGSAEFTVAKEICFEENNVKNLQDVLKKYEFELKNVSHKNSRVMDFTASYAGEIETNYTITSSPVGIERSKISIASNISCSYKDSKKNWKATKQVHEAVKSFICTTDQLAENNEDKYSIKIEVKKGKNPFYKLSVSHLNADIKYFCLEFNVNNNATVTITDNALQASSAKSSEIENIIKNYVILSKVG